MDHRLTGKPKTVEPLEGNTGENLTLDLKKQIDKIRFYKNQKHLLCERHC